MSQLIYLDYNATSPTDPLVLESMLPFYQSKFGNASSNTHLYGWEADLSVKKARKQIATFLGGNPDNIVFTSGATESNNMIFYSVAQALKSKGKHIITSNIEHKCILNCCSNLENAGYEVTYISADKDGFINPELIKEAIRPTTILISIMAANNEIGTIQPIYEIGEIAKNYGVLFHTDAAQVVGKIPFKISDQNVDFLSVSAHKMYGPKGIGLVYAKPLEHLQNFPLIQGGGQEKGMRSGTLNVPGIIGFAKACELANKDLKEEAERLLALKIALFTLLKQQIPEIKLNGSLERSLPGTLNITIPEISSVQLLSHLKSKFALSTGSACTSLNQEYSHVLRSIGCTEEEGKNSIRISFGRFTKLEEIDFFGKELVKYISFVQSKNNNLCSV